MLGTADELSNSAGGSYSGFGGQRSIAGINNRGDEGGSGGKKTPGEIIYRDSSTFLKVLLP